MATSPQRTTSAPPEPRAQAPAPHQQLVPEAAEGQDGVGQPPADEPAATTAAGAPRQGLLQEPEGVIRVLLADDHVMVRTGICSLLQFMDDVEVVGQASSGHEALRLIQNRQDALPGAGPGSAATDIAILDISMAGMNGLETAAHITRSHPETRVLMLSMHDSEEYVLQALRVGASGYLLKESSANELELAVRTVARGGIYLSPGVSRHSRHLVASYFSSQATSPEPLPATRKEIERAQPPAASATPATQPEPPQKSEALRGEAATLTPRQQEILRLLSHGLSNGQIARHLSISIKTVESHRAQLMSRLGIFDIAGLVRYAIRHGFSDPV